MPIKGLNYSANKDPDLADFHQNAAKLQLMMGHKTSVPTTATYRVSEIQKGLV